MKAKSSDKFFKTASTLLLPVLMLVCSFTSAAAAGWYDAAWQYRKPVTVDHTRVAASLTSFPMLIDVTDADLAAKAQTDADDILFTDADGSTKLAHEIELYQSATGRLLAWVKISSLSSAADTTIYMYYGNSGAGNQQNATSVWDANYRMVQHLEETSGTYYDSTANNNSGSPSGVTQGAAGRIDGAASFDGTDDSINCGNSGSLDVLNPITVEAWIKINSYGESYAGRIFDKANSSSQGRMLFVDGYNVPPRRQCLDFVQTFSTTSGTWRTPVNSIQAGQWYHVAVAYDARLTTNDPVIYINGNVQTLSEVAAPVGTFVSDAGSNLLLGLRSDSNRDFDGIMDEVRVSSGVRSAQWIATEYNNQSSPATFSSAGSEDALPQEPIISNEQPANSITDVAVSLTELSFTLTDPNGDTMSYNVSASPDIIGGIQSGSSISSGTTIHIPITAGTLAYNTTYSWTINATDGTHPVIKNYSFTTRWGEAGWQYRKEIRIEASKITADLTGFPLLIDVIDSDFSAHALESGNDFVFTDYAKMKLNHEIEFYDHLTGHLIVWVRTDLSASSDTILYLYYGNPGSASQQNREAVWDEDYVMVQHLAEASGTHFDSTSYSNDGTPENGVIQGAIGRIDGADSFDGVDDAVNFGKESSLNNIEEVTLESWIYLDSYGQLNAGRVFDKANRILFVDGYYDLITPTPRRCLDFYQAFTITTGIWRTPQDSIQTGQWYHVAVMYNNSLATNDPMIYVNGNLQTLAEVQTPVGSAVSDAVNNLLIGRRLTDPGGEYGGYRGFDGSMDEVRISNTVRSEAWIAAEYANQSNPSDFYNMGESVPTAITLASFDAKAGNNKVTLKWVTGDETDNLGFNIYRADAQDGEYVKINASLIASKVGSGLGTTYEFVDNNVKNLKTYFYKIEDVDVNGTATQHGPIAATPRLIYGLFQ